MAIIDIKRLEADEEAERNARLEAEEYAARHDTAAAPAPAWQQPPPAYEEAAGQSSSSQPNVISGPSDQSQIHEEEYRFEAGTNHDERRQSVISAQQIGIEQDRSQEVEHNESTPLLIGQQRRLFNKRLLFNAKYHRACRFTSALLLVGIIIIMFVILFSYDFADEELPEPWPTDGKPVESVKWSKIEETSKETWTSPNVPEYFCTANFSIAANESLAFVRTHGSSYFGSAHASPSALFPREDWNYVHGGEGFDRIAIMIGARFTNPSLLKAIRIDKMVDDKDPNKVAEGISINSKNSASSGRHLISLEVLIVLPSPTYRTPSGLAKDGSSWIPAFEFASDTLRFGFEDSIKDTPKEDKVGVSFGKIDALSRIGGITLMMHMRANESASFHVDSGPIRDFFLDGDHNPINVAAPKVDISVGSGPIWLTGVVGIESVKLRTIVGGLNISQIATAKRVDTVTTDGLLAGRYSAHESLYLHTTNFGRIEADVNANSNYYAEIVKRSGILDIMEPTEVKKLMDEIVPKSKWRTLSVQTETRAGSTAINYFDQDIKTLLFSNVSTVAGSATVHHSDGFEGQFELQTKTGSIRIKEPKVDNPDSDKNFILDTDDDRGGIDRLVKGRLWYKEHQWEEGGSSRRSSFPISHSELHSNIGSVELQFS